MPFASGIPDFGLGTTFTVGNILKGVIGNAADSTDDSIHEDEVEFDLLGATGAKGNVSYEIEPEDFGLKTKLSPNSGARVSLTRMSHGSTQIKPKILAYLIGGR